MQNKQNDNQFQCIYCMEQKPASSFTKVEHVIPQSFGVFKNNFTLHNAVCDDCNQYFGDNLEIALARDSLEGLSRYEFGVKKPHQLKAIRKKTRIITKVAEGEWKGSFAYREYSEQQGQVVIKPFPQIGFLNPDALDYKYYLLSYVPDRKTLESLGFDLSRPKSMMLLGVDLNDAVKVLQSKGISFKAGGEISPAVDDKDMLCEVEATIDETIFRAVAKIALNYLVYWEGSGFVCQTPFHPIREFVRQGRKPTYPLVKVSNQPALGDERETDKRRLGHVITLNWAIDDVSIVSHVSLMNWARYSVSLAKNFTGEKKDLTRGHFFNLHDFKIIELEARRNIPET